MLQEVLLGSFWVLLGSSWVLLGPFQGRIQEFWLGGAWIFFSKAWGLGAALRPPEGPGQRPDSFQGAKPPEAPNFSDFRSKI